MTTPAWSLEAICDALAARFITSAIGSPTGAVPMKASYSEPPKSVPTVPAHLLEVVDGDITDNSSQWTHHLNIDGVLLLSKRPGDTKRVETQRRLWLPYLLHAAVDQWKLGIGAQVGYELKSAIPGGWEFTEYNVADVEFDAIRVHWQVWLIETIAPTP
jgi:hypothetical protein